MTNDLRAAAERVVALSVQASESEDDEYSVMLLTEEAASLGCKLARHILASHPPDGETEIDEETEPVEYRDALGFLCRWQIVKWPLGGYALKLKQVAELEPCKADEWDGYDCVMFKVTTRSDLHRLCAALGIPLKEEKGT